MSVLSLRVSPEELKAFKTAAELSGHVVSHWAKQVLVQAAAPGSPLAERTAEKAEAKKKPPLPEPDPPLLEVPDPPELSGVARSSSHPDKVDFDKVDSSRKAAIEVGRLIGEDQARREGLRGRQASQQIARAKRYAAWEYDGKPVGTEHARRYDKEFPGSAVSEAVSGPTLRALA